MRLVTASKVNALMARVVAGQALRKAISAEKLQPKYTLRDLRKHERARYEAAAEMYERAVRRG